MPIGQAMNSPIILKKSISRRCSSIFGGLWLFLVWFVCFPQVGSAQIVVNEFLAANVSGLLDEDGEYSDWIEIWNNSAQAVNLSGYTLTDTEVNLDKWTFPSHVVGPDEYLIVFASNKDRRVAGQEFHTNFRLTSAGEYLALVEPDGSTIAFEYAPTFPVQFDGVSYGLESNSGSLPGKYLDSATPGSGNSQGDDLYKAFDPSYSVERGFFDSSFNLQLSSSQGLNIRYTTNGSAPSSSTGTLYSGSISITTTTSVRAIAYGSGVNDSDIATHSYIFLDNVLAQSYMSGHVGVSDAEMKDALKDIPTISLTAPIINYSGGNNNFIESAVSVEYWNPDGSEVGFHIDAGFETWGGSPANPKKHYRLEFKSQYGEPKLRYPIFETDGYAWPIEPVEEFDKLLLRGGSQDGLNGEFGNEDRAQFIRNQFIFDLQMKLGYPAPHGRWVHVYLNGEYRGFYHLLERPDEKFMSAYYGNTEDQYEVRKSGDYWAGNGSFYSSLESASNNLGSSSGFNNAKDYVDMEQAADYLSLNHLGANFDWNKDHNSLGSADITPGNGGYKFQVWDYDLTLGNGGKWHLDSPTLDYSYKEGPVPENLFDNGEFRLLWADQLECQCYNGGDFTVDSLKALYNRRADQARVPLLAESSRWGDVSFSVNDAIDRPNWRSNLHWETELTRMNDVYFPQRLGNFIQHKKNRGVIPNLSAVTYNTYGGVVPNGFGVQLSKSTGGTIYYTTDGSDPRNFGGSVSGSASAYSSPITVTATTMIKARVLQSGVWSAMCPREFYPTGYFMDLAINEIHYNPSNAGTPGLPDFVDGDLFEFLEIKNNGSNAVDVSGVELSDGVEYTFPQGASVAAGGFLTLASDSQQFFNRYGFQPDGVFVGNLSNSGERIELRTPYASILDSLTYSDGGLWNSLPDGDGPSLSLDPLLGSSNDNPSDWYASSVVHGSPNAENSVNQSPIVNIDLPLNGARFDPGVAFAISLTASDPDDSVDSVRVETGGFDIGTDETAPYEIMWTPPPGEYRIHGKAWDGFGSRALSDTVLVYVRSENACTGVASLVINEINYNDNDPGGPLTGDWLEIFNPGSSSVDLSGWTFKDEKNENWFVIPGGVSIPGKGYHVLVQDDALFSSVHAISNKSGDFSFGLDGSGDHLRLYSPSGCLVDEVSYLDVAPWPIEADGLGNTLELMDPAGDNNTPSVWKATGPIGGTPGEVNDGLSVQVSLLTPANNVGYIAGIDIEVNARALSGASFSSVALWLDGELFGEMTQDPNDSSLFSVTLTGLAEGFHDLEVRASNTAGLSDQSNVSTICIGQTGSGAFAEAGGQVVFEAENFSSSTDRGTDSWEIESSKADFVGDAYMVTLPDDGTKITTNYAATSSELQFEVEFSTTGTYYLFYRGWADSGTNNSVHFGLDGVELVGLRDVSLGSNYGFWSWASLNDSNEAASFEITNAGLHTINLWLREDGTFVDRILLSTDPNFTPTDGGPEESQRIIGDKELRLNLSAILSGAWNGTEMNTAMNSAGILPLDQPYAGVPSASVDAAFFAGHPDIVDWVWVELRSSTDAASSLAKQAAFITKTGGISAVDGSAELGFSGLNAGEYHVVIGHRNHLSIMSKDPLNFLFSSPANFDFTSDENLVYATSGEVMKDLGSGKWGLWAGDTNSDGTIRYTGSNNDRVDVLSRAGGPSPFNFNSGYFPEDVNLDGVVKYAGANNDRVPLLEGAGGPSAFSSRSTQVP